MTEKIKSFKDGQEFTIDESDNEAVKEITKEIKAMLNRVILELHGEPISLDNIKIDVETREPK